MPEVSWVRLSTRMFENRKIKHLLSQPKGAELTLLWVRLLCLAGIINDGGKIYVTAKVPYTPQTLAADTGIAVTVVKKAWELFQDLELLNISQEGYIVIIGWEKHQNIDGLNKMRAQTRERVKRHRERNSNVNDTPNEYNSDTDVTQDETQDTMSCNVTETLQKHGGNTDETQQNKNKNKNKEKEDDYHHLPKRKTDDDENTQSEIFPLWEKNISPLTALIGEKLQALIAETGETAVEHGIIAAVEHGARNFSYVQTVARNYASGGKNAQKAQSDKANLSYSEIAREMYGEKSAETP